MNIFCKLKLHKWNEEYTNLTAVKGNYSIYSLYQITRYCTRCEKIERAFWIPNLMFPPRYEKLV